MKQLLLPFIFVLIAQCSSIYSQNKKTQIESLMKSKDSLENVLLMERKAESLAELTSDSILSSKNENILKLRLKNDSVISELRKSNMEGLKLKKTFTDSLFLINSSWKKREQELMTMYNEQSTQNKALSKEMKSFKDSLYEERITRNSNQKLNGFELENEKELRHLNVNKPSKAQMNDILS